ncbi:hypothetical protein [Rhizobium mesosinicum]|uniref:Uncharacterized protein n=1 Tax=Rhizobium mesosinicum TaxID=335017 RepID=A0ABS7GNY8_9HYPH|nr:hypothetical protein [Rhizobium mesosinicum]MBW9050949.1 hypothetical protein [Rhizobium mesosinicum]
MQTLSRALADMTLQERTNMVDVVVEALEAFAEEAENDGDERFARDSKAIACTIRGCGNDLSKCELETAELLLEFGIQFMYAYTCREQELDSEGSAALRH